MKPLFNETCLQWSISVVIDHFFLTSLFKNKLYLNFNQISLGYLGEQVGIGSISGGGRYDELVGMFDAKGRKVFKDTFFLLRSLPVLAALFSQSCSTDYLFKRHLKITTYCTVYSRLALLSEKQCRSYNMEPLHLLNF